MIDSSIRRLSQGGWNVDSKVLMTGFSASGVFANCFTILHPKRVIASAIGSPGGQPISPIGTWEGKHLRYPVGGYDLKGLVGKTFDLESYKAVPYFFYLGENDDNDSVPFAELQDHP